MYCPKCKYTSFDYYASCPKCGRDWTSEKKQLGLEWIKEGQGSWIDSDTGHDSDQENMEGVARPENFDFHSLQEDPVFDEEFDVLKDSALPDTKQPDNDKAQVEYNFQQTEEVKGDIVVPGKSEQHHDSGLDQEIEYPDLEFIEENEKK
ncbi:hypothetical protein [Desulfonatronovibrio magnus]|uniref:hypothetical protein n=1 Tax=Desulfonatronovibrio magnus TaxID=698827 RepID=UPI0005EB0BD6|nr:hypothetical protein [Desulfonatronovibrio magnus]